MYIKRLPAQLTDDGKYINRLKLTFSNSDEYSFIMNKLSMLSSKKNETNTGKVRAKLAENVQKILTSNFTSQDKTENNHPSCVINDWTIETVLPLLFLVINENGTDLTEEEFKKQKQDLFELQKKYISIKEINENLANQINEKKQNIENIQSQIKSLSNENLKLSSENEKLKSVDVNNLKEQFTILNNDKQSLEIKNNELSKQLKAENFKVVEKDNQIKNLNNEIIRLNNSIKELSNVEKENNNNTEINSKIENLQKEYQEKIDNLQITKDEALKELQEEKDKTEKLQKKFNELSLQKTTEPVNADLYSDANKWHESYDELKKRYDDINLKYSETIHKYDSSKEENEKLESEIKALKEQTDFNEKCKETINKLEKQVKDLNRQSEIFKLTIAKLKNTNDKRKDFFHKKK